jgi:hypothetical protein
MKHDAEAKSNPSDVSSMDDERTYRSQRMGPGDSVLELTDCPVHWDIWNLKVALVSWQANYNVHGFLYR